jgi:redox-sensitive bicupin YhaK (pirin superfamily)
MFKIHKSGSRGHTKTNWLDSRHSFSFGDYYDPKYMGFSVIKVINEDKIAPTNGFAIHLHKDMEIITYIIDGALTHKDSLGNGSIIATNEVQRMSAGTGIMHSEFNYNKTDPVHFLQIWILPEVLGLQPDYEQKNFKQLRRPGRFCRICCKSEGTKYFKKKKYKKRDLT